MPDQYILCVDGRRVERLHDAATKPNIRSLEDRHPPAIETPPYPFWEALRPFCRVLLSANRAVANTSQRSLVHAMITLGGRPLPHLPRGLNNRNMLINVWESSSFWGRCGAGGGSKTWIHLRCGGAAERPGTRQAPTNSGQRRARASDTRNEIWCLCGFTCCWSYTRCGSDLGMSSGIENASVRDGCAAALLWDSSRTSMYYMRIDSLHVTVGVLGVVDTTILCAPRLRPHKFAAAFVSNWFPHQQIKYKGYAQQ